jgi:2-oxoglutarate dehydrogenase E1 component
MGAWTYVAPRLRAAVGTAMQVTYIGRPERASPAEGYQASHQREQSRIVAEALDAAGAGSRRPAVGGSTATGNGRDGPASPAAPTSVKST